MPAVVFGIEHFLYMGITFASLREASREVIVEDIFGVKCETVTYNEGYTP